MTFLLSCTLRASAILAAGLLTSSCLKYRSAALRHFVLAVAILSAAAVPALMLVMPARPIVVWTERETVTEPAPAQLVDIKEYAVEAPAEQADATLLSNTEPSATTATPSASTAPSSEQVSGPTPVDKPLERASQPANKFLPASAQANSAQLDPLALVMGVWLAGVFVGLTSLFGGVLHLRRLVSPHRRLSAGTRWAQIAAEVAAQYGLRRRIELFECRTASILATWGMTRPKLLLPAGAELWPEDRIRVVIHHELAHIRRGDWWIQVVAELHRAVFWFNPLYWMTCRRLVLESEQACDDVALGQGLAGSEYAEHLLDLTRALKTPRGIWSTALSMARESTLERRFAAILNPQTDRGRVRRVAMLTTLLVFAGVALSLTSFRAASATTPVAEAVLSPSPIEESPAGTLATALTGIVSPAQTQPGGPGSIGSIRGRVMLLGGNEPVAAASVELRRIDCGEGGMAAEVYTALTGLPNPYWTQGAGPLTPPQVFKATTGGDGRFAFDNLTAGSYCIVAFRGGGYLPAEYLQRSTRGPGSTIALTEGQQISNLNLALTPMGSISGRVTDANGEPVAYAQVQALETLLYDGRRQWSVATSLQTNDLGEYRLFWLAPGRYYVAATLEDPDRRTVRSNQYPAGRMARLELMTYPVMKYRELEDGTLLEETYSYVYYGGGTDPQKALPVEVRAGSNTAGVDIPLGVGKQRSWRVRGTVTNGVTGQAASNVSVRLMPRDWMTSLIVPSATSNATGAFDIAGVVPGSYFLWATGRNDAGRGARAGIFGQGAGDPIPVPELIARIPVTVGAADLTGLKVVIASGFNLAGRVSIEGLSSAESAALLTQIRVRPLREPDIIGQPAALARDPVPSGADGSFTLTGIGPGDYRVFVEPLIIPPRIVPPPPPPAPLQATYVKAIRLGNQDVLSQGLHINGPPDGQLEVLIGKAGEIRGRVIDSRQQPVVNVTVVAIPESPLRNRPDLYRKTRTDSSGRFRLYGVAPGDFKLFAWEKVEEGLWYDPDLLRPVENRGRAVRVTEGRTENVEVPVIAR